MIMLQEWSKVCPTLFYGRNVLFMETSALLLCIVFMLVGLQFLRGKWLNLLTWLQQFSGNTVSANQLNRA